MKLAKMPPYIRVVQLIGIMMSLTLCLLGLNGLLNSGTPDDVLGVPIVVFSVFVVGQVWALDFWVKRQIAQSNPRYTDEVEVPMPPALPPKFRE